MFELTGDGVHHLRDLAPSLAVGVAAAAQLRLHLRLDDLDHVLDQAVQFIRWAAGGGLHGGQWFEDTYGQGLFPITQKALR